MGMEIPGEVKWLSWIIGQDWPEGDETAMRRLATTWEEAATGVDDLTGDLQGSASRVLSSVDGPAAEQFRTFWEQFVTTDPQYLPKLAEKCRGLAEECNNGANEIEYGKYMFIALLIMTAIEIIMLIEAAFATFGASAAGIPVVEVGAQVISRSIARELLTAILRGAARGLLENVGLDVLIQGIQIAEGHRDGLDLAKTGNAALDGAMGGAISGGIGHGAGKIPGLSGGDSPLGGIVRGVIRDGASEAVSGVASTVASTAIHGGDLSPEALAKAATSGAFGGAVGGAKEGMHAGGHGGTSGGSDGSSPPVPGEGGFSGGSRSGGSSDGGGSGGGSQGGGAGGSGGGSHDGGSQGGGSQAGGQHSASGGGGHSGGESGGGGGTSSGGGGTQGAGTYGAEGGTNTSSGSTGSDGAAHSSSAGSEPGGGSSGSHTGADGGGSSGGTHAGSLGGESGGGSHAGSEGGGSGGSHTSPGGGEPSGGSGGHQTGSGGYGDGSQTTLASASGSHDGGGASPASGGSSTQDPSANRVSALLGGGSSGHDPSYNRISALLNGDPGGGSPSGGASHGGGGAPAGAATGGLPGGGGGPDRSGGTASHGNRSSESGGTALSAASHTTEAPAGTGRVGSETTPGGAPPHGGTSAGGVPMAPPVGGGTPPGGGGQQPSSRTGGATTSEPRGSQPSTGGERPTRTGTERPSGMGTERPGGTGAERRAGTGTERPAGQATERQAGAETRTQPGTTDGRTPAESSPAAPTPAETPQHGIEPRHEGPESEHGDGTSRDGPAQADAPDSRTPEEQLHAAEAEARQLLEQFGSDAPRVDFTSNPIDPAAARAINDALQSLAADYPGTVRQLNNIGSTDPANAFVPGEGTLAYALTSGPDQGVYVSPEDFRSAADLSADGAGEVADGWTVPGGGGPEGVFNHEFGHQLGEQLLNDPQALNDLNHAVSDVLGQPYDASQPHDAATAAALERMLSEYGATEPHEMMAEAFAEYRGSENPRPLAQAIGGVMDQHLRAHGTTPGDGSTGASASGHDPQARHDGSTATRPPHEGAAQRPPDGASQPGDSHQRDAGPPASDGGSGTPPRPGDVPAPREGTPRTPHDGAPQAPRQGVAQGAREGGPRSPHDGAPRTSHDGAVRSPHGVARTHDPSTPARGRDGQSRTSEHGRFDRPAGQPSGRPGTSEHGPGGRGSEDPHLRQRSGPRAEESTPPPGDGARSGSENQTQPSDGSANKPLTLGDDGRLHRDGDKAHTYRDADGTLHKNGDSEGSYRTEDQKLHFHGDEPGTFRNDLTQQLQGALGRFVKDPLTERPYDYTAEPAEPKDHNPSPSAKEKLEGLAAERDKLVEQRADLAREMAPLREKLGIQDPKALVGKAKLDATVTSLLTDASNNPHHTPEQRAEIRAAVEELRDRAQQHNQALKELVRVSEKMGMAGAEDFATNKRGGTLLTPRSDKPGTAGTLDVVSFAPGPPARLICVEAKGGDSQLGGRVVESGRKAQQGSPEYLSWILARDPDLSAALEANPPVRDQIQQALESGTLQYEYHRIHADVDGSLTHSAFKLRREGEPAFRSPVAGVPSAESGGPATHHVRPETGPSHDGEAQPEEPHRRQRRTGPSSEEPQPPPEEFRHEASGDPQTQHHDGGTDAEAGPGEGTQDPGSYEGADSDAAAKVAVADQIGSASPELATVINHLLDDPHQLNLTAALRDAATREQTLALIRQLAEGDALGPYGGDLNGFLRDNPGAGPLFEPVRHEVNYTEGGESRKQDYVEDAKKADPARQAGRDPTPEQEALVRDYAQRLKIDVEPAVREEINRIIADLGLADEASSNVRTKDATGLHDKVDRMTEGRPGAPGRTDYQVGDIIDAVGARITVRDMAGLNAIYERIQSHYGVGDGGRILEVENMYAEPKAKAPAYRVVPMIISVQVNGVPYTFELQLTTQRASIAADIEHNSIYKPYVPLSAAEEEAVVRAMREAAALDQQEPRG